MLAALGPHARQHPRRACPHELISPAGELFVPGERVLGQRGGGDKTLPVGGAEAPLDAAVADIDNDLWPHGVASARTSFRLSATVPTSCDSPWPVTAEMAITSRPSSRTSRSRTSPLPVSSALLSATTSGFAAKTRLYNSSSLRMVR